MLGSTGRIAWDQPRIAIPAFLTIIAIPLTYSIATGLSFGLISYAAIELLTGQASRRHLTLYALAALFLFRLLYIAHT